jgi:hypothetical protein
LDLQPDHESREGENLHSWLKLESVVPYYAPHRRRQHLQRGGEEQGRRRHDAIDYAFEPRFRIQTYKL